MLLKISYQGLMFLVCVFRYCVDYCDPVDILYAVKYLVIIKFGRNDWTSFVSENSPLLWLDFPCLDQTQPPSTTHLYSHRSIRHRPDHRLPIALLCSWLRFRGFLPTIFVLKERKYALGRAYAS